MLTKKLRRNKPFRNASGQYNFDLNTNLGEYPYMEDKFLDKDLYSINEGQNVNEAILNVPYTIPMYNDSHFTIDNLNIAHSTAGGKEKNVAFAVWITDSVRFNEEGTIDLNNTSYNEMKARLSELPAIYSWNKGSAGAGWAPGSIFNDSQIFTGLFEAMPTFQYNSGFNAYPQSSVNTNFFEANEDYFDNTLSHSGGPGDYPDESTNHKIYVIVIMHGDSDTGWFGITDHRRSRLQLFEIDVNDVVDESREEEYAQEFEYGDSYMWEGEYGGYGGSVPHFLCNKLEIRISRGFGQFEDLSDLPEIQTLAESGVGVIDFPLFISNDDYNGIVRAKPGRIIDWEKTSVGSNIDFDFYPGTNITTANTDVQSYYENENDRFKASSPTTIDLQFEIYGKTTAGELLPHILTTDQEKIKFKFFVIDWDDKQNKIYNWNTLSSNWVENMDDFINRQQDGLFEFGEMSAFSHGTTMKYLTTKSLNHTYISPGLKNIKAIIFSYLEDTDGVQFQILRWKFVTSRIYLDNAKSLLEDFSDIGGADFVTLPWPSTTPIISGISLESQYLASIKNVLSSGKISEVDILDSSTLLRARDNDELGDYLGYTDFEQTRVFNQPYSMAELLKIDDHITTTDLNPHTDDTYWDLDGDLSIGGTNTFPTESCVGTIFINDNMDQNLRNSCIIELNPQELEGDIIRDSAGNGNKGILIGDYRIDKPSEDVPIRRKTEPKLSEKDSENGAI